MFSRNKNMLLTYYIQKQRIREVKAAMSISFSMSFPNETCVYNLIYFTAQ